MAKSGQKLTQTQVNELIRRRVSGETERTTCEEMGISKSTYHLYARCSGRADGGDAAKVVKADVPTELTKLQFYSILGLHESGSTPGDISVKTKTPIELVKRVLATHGSSPTGPNDSGVVSFASKGDDADGEYVTGRQPTEQTLEGILRECGADLTTWQVKEWSYKAWTTGMKVKGADGEGVKYGKQYSIHVKFKRVMAVSLQKATDAIFERMAKHAPKYTVPNYKRPKGGMLAGAYLYDVHFGKLCWGKETGGDYDLSIATNRFNAAVDDMVGHAAGQGVTEWLFPVGQDYFHIDSRNNTTFNGTPQDVDGRYERVIEAGESAAIRAVEAMAAVGPVRVVWVPGNHDTTASYHLARTLWAWFGKHKGVTVDVSPCKRKYVRWGKTLFGLCHSDKERVNDLASIMATERPDDWAATTCREWVVGHRHHPEKWQTKPVDSRFGVTVRTIHSLSGTDAWHHGKGYVGEPKAAEVHYYHADYGYDSHKLIRARA